MSVWVQSSITFLDFSLVKMHVLGFLFFFFLYTSPDKDIAFIISFWESPRNSDEHDYECFSYHVTDFDDCQIWGTCDQKCENRQGRHQCLCEEGYVLERGQHCKANNSCEYLNLTITFWCSLSLADGRRNNRISVHSKALSSQSGGGLAAWKKR